MVWGRARYLLRARPPGGWCQVQNRSVKWPGGIYKFLQGISREGSAGSSFHVIDLVNAVSPTQYNSLY